jgi:hypothetical protein
MGRLSLLLSALLFFVPAFATSAKADPSCVTYLVTGPVVGTIQGTRCIPLPSPFDVPVSLSNCRGVPPLGITICVGFELHI